MIPDGHTPLQPISILLTPHSHPPTQQCKCVSSIHQRWRLGVHELALTSSSHPCLPLQWCFPRTCWRRAWKRTTLPCWDSETSSFQVTGPGQGPKCRGWKGIPWRRSRPVKHSLTHQEREEGRVRLCDSPITTCPGFGEGDPPQHTWSTNVGWTLGRNGGEQDCPHGAWLGEQTLLESCRNKCI